MATFGETFLCTAVPETVSGTKIRVAVLVSPRLTSSDTAAAALDNWPDARDWPGIHPTWQLTITQGATTVTLPATEVVAEPYDQTSWSALFPPAMPVTPYQPRDRSYAPIVSYPVGKVRDAVKELHLSVLTDARAEHPTVAQLDQMPRFQDLKRAADPDYLRNLNPAQQAAPAHDDAIDIPESFARTHLFHGVRPGSQRPVPSVEGVSPGAVFPGNPVTITGTNFIAPLTVKFGEVAATEVRVVSPQTITCVANGQENTTVTVRVTTIYGTSPATPEATFRFKGLT